jgi:uncharacterized protein YjdB
VAQSYGASVIGSDRHARRAASDSSGSRWEDRYMVFVFQLAKLAKRLALLGGIAAAAVVAGGACTGADTLLAPSPDDPPGSDAPPVAAVIVSPPADSTAVGATVRFTAIVQDSLGTVLTGRPVTWITGDSTIAVVDTSGVVTGLAPGVVPVVASSGGATAQATLIVGPTPVAAVVVLPTEGRVAVGTSSRMTATALDAAGQPLAGRTIAWATSNPDVAAVSADGLVTGVAAGSANIAATCEGMSDTAVITVETVPVASVTVSPASATLVEGESTQFDASVRDEGGQTLADRVVAWATSDPTIATVSATGLVTGVAAGTARISATSEGKSDTATVTVNPVPVASVSVSPASASVLVGATTQLTATVRDGAGTTLTGRTVTWATSAAAVATVSSAGLVTGVAAGTATITATSEGVSGTATITASVPTTSTCDATGSGVCRYVDAASGNDANPGTSSQPYRTLQQAANVVNPGDVVIVRNGVYTGGSTVLGISRSGTSSNGIVFRAETRWGAVIDGQNSSSSGGVNISGSYIRVQGFEVRGTSRYGIEAYGGRDVQVAQNHIHAIGNVCSSSSGGIVGINAYVSNMVIERNLVHDVGRYADGENGCSPTNTYWQNHDHGIYHGQGDNVIIRNNVFYDLTHGWAIQRYNGGGTVASNLSIVNNTFVGANPYRDGQIIIATGTSNLLIANNLFYQPKTAGVYFDAGGLTGTMANNLTYGASLSTGSTSSIVITSNLVNQDPKFVNTGTRDFHLQAGSPAISAGLMLSGVLDDFDGLLRLAGVAPEIGAYRYQ